MAKKSTASAQLSFGLIILDPEAYRQQQQKKGRPCLCCSRNFQSDGPGNRICLKCKKGDAWNSPTVFSVAAAAF